MIRNEPFKQGICLIFPQGDNSTLFTECCEVAICDHEKTCPRCGREVIGSECETDGERHKIRWKEATQTWNRS